MLKVRVSFFYGIDSRKSAHSANSLKSVVIGPFLLTLNKMFTYYIS